MKEQKSLIYSRCNWTVYIYIDHFDIFFYTYYQAKS